ncbi:MAG: hypothetical protein HYT61_01460 [Candidatus Yanofskybacteria bacterium]|nr:hypothetical protein [Candidatus Yanofskybacteria bacterium]
MENKIKLYTVSIFVFFISVSFSASADTLGQNQRFFISSQYDAQSRESTSATLRHVSEHAYFYIADDYWNVISTNARNQVLNKVEIIAREFDGRIYPIETQFFGSEPNPGIDGDSRITILMAPLIENAGGYFDAVNQYSISEANNSNQREIIYLNVKEVADQARMFIFLAHEFQHLISFNQKEKLRNIYDDIWLNELRSEYAPTLLGYNDIFLGSNLEKRSLDLSDAPSDSLTEWKNLPADYGQIGMFSEYIAEHWSPQVIADTLKNNLKSIPSFNYALSQNGFSDNFTDVYRDWLISNYLNDDSYNGKFGYSRIDLANFKVSATKTLSNLDDNAAFLVSGSIKDWQGRWYDLIQLAPGQKNVLKISFTSSSLASFYVPYVVFDSTGKHQLYIFNPTPSSNAIYVSNIGADVRRVLILPIKKDKLSNFFINETSVRLDTTFERVASVPSIISAPVSVMADSVPSVSDTKYEIPKNNFPDGSLIRARGDYKVYVVKGKWRRHIIDSRIFNFYPGLGFEKVTEVEPSILNQYQESDLVRYADSQRVYSIDKIGVRHWLDISGAQFTASGRAWDAIFEVNIRELNFYKIGTSIVE